MSRTSRSFSLASIMMLVYSLFAVVAAPTPAHAQSVITVNTTRDLLGTTCGSYSTVARPQYTQYCSLRQALHQAIDSGGNTTITFAIPSFDATFSEAMPGFDITTSTWTIVLGFIDPSVTPVGSAGDPLPPITSPNIHIAGDTQADFSGISQVGPQIFIDGTFEDEQGGIMVSGTSNVTIERLGIVNFGGDPVAPGDFGGVGIELFQTTDSFVVGCYIGVGQNGTTAKPNDAAGILIQGGNNNTIGGRNSDNDKYNVISGNTNDGILIRQNATNMVVIGNRIGVNTVGNVAIPNGRDGIRIEAFSTNNRIGALENQSETDETLRNTIAGNGAYGIMIDRTNNNFVYGNWIGADNFFNARVPNRLGGIRINSAQGQPAQGNRIGGIGSKARNIISGNNGPGILLTGTDTNANVISNNWIGIGFSNAVPVSNTIGINMQGGGDRNIIGGNGDPTRDNYIGGNSQSGILIEGGIGTGETNPLEAQDNVISGNKIGVIPSASMSPAGNGFAGIAIGGFHRRTIIGGPNLESSNIVSNNGTDGILIAGSKIISPTIGSNTIERNGRDGISIIGSTSGDVVGLTITGLNNSPNIINQNAVTGIDLLNTRLSDVRLNTITNHAQGGIRVENAQLTTIGFNSVNLNSQDGIRITNGLTNTLEVNTLDQNTGTGILLSGSNYNVLTENIVKASTVNGIQASNSKFGTLQFNLVERSGQSGIILDTNSQHFQLDTTDVYTSTLAGLTISNSTWVSATLGILRANTGGGVLVNGPARHVTVNDYQILLNGSHGIAIAGVAPTTNITLTTNLLQENTGSGIRITGDLPVTSVKPNVLIRFNSIVSNTVDGIHIGDGGAGPHPQRVWIDTNIITRNGIPPGTPLPVGPGLLGRGIVLDPDTAGTPGTATNPNHDIEPPYQLVVSQDGVVTGKVYVDGSNAACMPALKCLLQFFIPNQETLDGQAETPVDPSPVIDATGNFTATLGFVPTQFTVTATDALSNTSEFALFVPNPQVTITPGTSVNARPSDVVTFTHQVVNTTSSNILFTHLRIIATSEYDHWITTPQPSSTFSLAPGQSIPVTVTVKLPAGPDPQVNVGVTGKITVTVDAGSSGPDALINVFAVNQITIDPRVVITLSEGQAKSGAPGTVVTYQHTVTNLGNITADITPSVATTVGGQPAPTWVTNFSPPTLTLAPGQSGTITINVTVSPGSSAGPPPNTAQTTLTVTPSVGGIPDLGQVKTAVDTTSTALVQTATLVPSRTRDATAGETVVVEHTVTNTSNGEATFKIASSVTQGSTVSYILPAAPGVTVLGGNVFKLSNAPGFNTYTFSVVIQVHRGLLAGQKEFVTISLTDPNNNPIPSTTVLDTINITRAIIYPRIYLPLIDKP